MQRTNAYGSVGGLYTVGPPATRIEADEMNALQEEIARTIELAGLALAPGDNEQLYAAIGVLIAAAIADKAPLNSPALAGTPTAPTPATADNSTKLANTAFVQSVVAAAIANLINAAPGALDTLEELAQALGDDPNFAATMTAALAAKADDAAVTDALALKAPLSSPAFTDAPTAPTPAVDAEAGELATAELVQHAAGAATAAAVPAAGTLTLDLAASRTFSATLDAAATLAFDNVPATLATRVTLVVTQDGTGGWALTWPATMKWPGAVPPAQTAAANAIDWYEFLTVDGGVTWFGSARGEQF